jgi:glycosyltransferase involved in cell wall biosynthesis
MSNPLVSVIIPAYNAEKYISETIQSVLNQEHTAFELIIVNDGSTDGTEKVIRTFSDDRIKYIQQANKGCSGAKNTGLHEASGDFIQYLDADDLLSADKISEQVKILLNDPYAVAVCKTKTFITALDEPQAVLVDPDFIYNTDDTFAFLLNLYGIHGKSGMIQPNAFLISRTLSDKAGIWDESISPSPDEDGEYFCRVILAAKKICFTPAGTNYYRRQNSGSSLSKQVSHQHARGALGSLQAITRHLLACENSDRVKQLMAKHFAGFIYHYADYSDLCILAEKDIRALGIKRLPVAGGKNFRRLAAWTGFKNALFIKKLFSSKRNA